MNELLRKVAHRSAGWRKDPPFRRHVLHGDHILGTSFELQVWTNDASAAPRAEARAIAEVRRLEAILSGWSSSSELARWSSTPGVDAPVSAELAEVLELAQQWRVRTSGAFSPRAAIGQRDELCEPLWQVNRARGIARRSSPLPTSLDAIAKGYIVSKAAASARQVSGVSAVLVNIGGDIQHFGAEAVRVGITDPFAPAENAPLLAAVRIANEALATSGGYHRRIRAQGEWVSHIIDPRSGQPAHHVASASVIAPDCATADVLSTTFSVLTPHESLALADAMPGVACLLVERDGTIVTNARWERRALPGLRTDA